MDDHAAAGSATRRPSADPPPLLVERKSSRAASRQASDRLSRLYSMDDPTSYLEGMSPLPLWRGTSPPVEEYHPRQRHRHPSPPLKETRLRAEESASGCSLSWPGGDSEDCAYGKDLRHPMDSPSSRSGSKRPRHMVLSRVDSPDDQANRPLRPVELPGGTEASLNSPLMSWAMSHLEMCIFRGGQSGDLHPARLTVPKGPRHLQQPGPPASALLSPHSVMYDADEEDLVFLDHLNHLLGGLGRPMTVDLLEKVLFTFESVYNAHEELVLSMCLPYLPPVLADTTGFFQFPVAPGQPGVPDPFAQTDSLGLLPAHYVHARKADYDIAFHRALRGSRSSPESGSADGELDSLCDIALRCDACRDDAFDDTNELVVCESCGAVVHMACYGVQTVPETGWLCKTCEAAPLLFSPVGPARPPCILCPPPRASSHHPAGGFCPMKQTPAGEWVHASCAMWVPPVGVESVRRMEPVVGVADIDPARFTAAALVCDLCGVSDPTRGATLQCTSSSCTAVMHVECAVNRSLAMVMSDSTNESSAESANLEGDGPQAGAVQKKVFCLRHTPTRLRRRSAASLEGVVLGTGPGGPGGVPGNRARLLWLERGALLRFDFASAMRAVLPAFGQAFTQLLGYSAPDWLGRPTACLGARTPLHRVLAHWYMRRGRTGGKPLPGSRAINVELPRHPVARHFPVRRLHRLTESLGRPDPTVGLPPPVAAPGGAPLTRRLVTARAALGAARSAVTSMLARAAGLPTGKPSTVGLAAARDLLVSRGLARGHSVVADTSCADGQSTSTRQSLDSLLGLEEDESGWLSLQPTNHPADPLHQGLPVALSDFSFAELLSSEPARVPPATSAMGLLARALLLDDGCLFFEPPTSSKSNERATFSVRRRPGALGFGPSGSNSLVPDLSLEPAGLMGICASLARLPHACHKTPSPGARPGISCFLDFLPEGEAELSSQACMQLIPRPGLSVGCGALDLVAVRLVAFHCDLIVANALRAERHASAAGAFETRFARQYRHLAEGASGGITPAEPFVCLGAQCPGDLRPRRFPFMPSSEQPVGRPAALSFCARAASDRGPPSSSGSASTAGLLPDVLRALARAVLLLDCQMVLFSRESWGPIACGTRVGLDPALEQHLPGVDALLVRAGLLYETGQLPSECTTAGGLLARVAHRAGGYLNELTTGRRPATLADVWCLFQQAARIPAAAAQFLMASASREAVARGHALAQAIGVARNRLWVLLKACEQVFAPVCPELGGFTRATIAQRMDVWPARLLFGQECPAPGGGPHSRPGLPSREKLLIHLSARPTRGSVCSQASSPPPEPGERSHKRRACESLHPAREKPTQRRTTYRGPRDGWISRAACDDSDSELEVEL